MAVTDKRGKRRPFDPLAEKVKFSGIDGEEVKVTDISDRELQEAILIQLKLINLKLNCLQPDEEELDENDLDSIDQE